MNWHLADAERFLETFQALDIKHPPIYHERFLSPLPVSKEGWHAFANAIHSDNDDEWELWYVAENAKWLGRFYGSPIGWTEIRKAIKNLALLFGNVLEFDGLQGWIGALHEFAENTVSELLIVDRHVWNWEPDEHIDPEYASVEDVEPYLQLWDESPEAIRFPKHPLHQILRPNLVNATSLALDCVIHPETFVHEPCRRIDALVSYLHSLPEEIVTDADVTALIESICLSDDTATSEASIYEEWDYSQKETIAASEPMALPDYQFHKSGDTWSLRFLRSDGKVEHGILKSIKGLDHYAKLLASPDRTLSYIDFEPPAEPPTSRSAISQGNALDAADPETFSGFREEGKLWDSILDDQAITELAKAKVALEEQLEYENNNPAATKDLSQQLAAVEKELNQRRRRLGSTPESGKAYHRIKKALNDARNKLRKHNLSALADHLQANVSNVGSGYKYDPKPTPSWEFE